MTTQSKRQKLLEIARNKGSGRNPELPLVGHEPTRPKRKNGEVYKYLPARFVFKVPLRTKDFIATSAGNANMSQAEMGLVIMLEIENDPSIIERALANYQERRKQLEAEITTVPQPGIVDAWRAKTGWNRGRHA